jgi:hypothetical protein
MTSPDGVTWTSQTSAADNAWRSVAWSPELGLFCAVASSGTGDRVMTSPDGVTWTLRESATDNSWRSTTWSPELGIFAAVAYSGTGDRVMTSVSSESYSYVGIVDTAYENYDKVDASTFTGTIDLPSLPVRGQRHSVIITGGTPSTDNITVTSSDSLFRGAASPLVIDIDTYTEYEFIYVDSEYGWAIRSYV